MFQNKHHKTSVLRIHLITYAGLWVTRENLGLPEDWRKIERWIEDSKDIVRSCPNPYIPPTRKNLEIPILKSYDQKATDEFWSIFPKNFNQKVLKTVNIKALKKLIQKCWFSWTLPQRMTAKKALRQLQGFAPVKLKKDLPSVKTKNANSAIINGCFMTDAICSWVKKGYVVGPFDNPPLQKLQIKSSHGSCAKNKG
jgi:hypothetical protein